jgi:hypothetical protein
VGKSWREIEIAVAGFRARGPVVGGRRATGTLDRGHPSNVVKAVRFKKKVSGQSCALFARDTVYKSCSEHFHSENGQIEVFVLKWGAPKGSLAGNVGV